MIANCEVYNNVFYNNSISISVSYSRLTVYNNIFYLERENAVAVNKQKGSVISDYNLFYPEKAGFYVVADKIFNSLEQLKSVQGFDLHSLRDDPAFQDAFNNNFKPAEGSPIINAGKFVGLGYDFEGVNISDGGIPDMGIFEFKPQSTTAINNWSDEPPDNENIVRVFPNPSDGIVNVSFHSFDANACQVIIRNISGGVLSVEEVTNIYSGLTLTKDLSEYQPGIYFVECTRPQQSVVQKLIIQ